MAHQLHVQSCIIVANVHSQAVHCTMCIETERALCIETERAAMFDISCSIGAVAQMSVRSKGFEDTFSE